VIIGFSTENQRKIAERLAFVFRGARPADLPFEQPTCCRLVINKKALETLGLTIPPAILMRADKVVD
jgi:putative ABC transport system substrate-binding protein